MCVYRNGETDIALRAPSDVAMGLRVYVGTDSDDSRRRALVPEGGGLTPTRAVTSMTICVARRALVLGAVALRSAVGVLQTFDARAAAGRNSQEILCLGTKRAATSCRRGNGPSVAPHNGSTTPCCVSVGVHGPCVLWVCGVWVVWVACVARRVWCVWHPWRARCGVIIQSKQPVRSAGACRRAYTSGTHSARCRSISSNWRGTPHTWASP